MLDLIAALRAIDAVTDHDSRLRQETALKAPAAAMPAVIAAVEARLGPAVKATGAPVPGPLSADPLVVAMGGLRPAQTLYLGSAMYVAFWPWGSGSTITIKVGPTAR